MAILVCIFIALAYLTVLGYVVTFAIRAWAKNSIHLSTLIILTITTGGLIYGNLVPRGHKFIGWPVRIPPAETKPNDEEERVEYEDSDQEKWDDKYAVSEFERSIYFFYFAAPINLLAGLCSLLLVGYVSERLTRRASPISSKNPSSPLL